MPTLQSERRCKSDRYCKGDRETEKGISRERERERDREPRYREKYTDATERQKNKVNTGLRDRPRVKETVSQEVYFTVKQG